MIGFVKHPIPLYSVSALHRMPLVKLSKWSWMFICLSHTLLESEHHLHVCFPWSELILRNRKCTRLWVDEGLTNKTVLHEWRGERSDASHWSKHEGSWFWPFSTSSWRKLWDMFGLHPEDLTCLNKTSKGLWWREVCSTVTCSLLFVVSSVNFGGLLFQTGSLFFVFYNWRSIVRKL